MQTEFCGINLRKSYKGSIEESCPQAIIQRITLCGKRIAVVRDDLLPGGTKQRGLAGMLNDFQAKGFSQFIYASPFCGYAQIALAYLCDRFGLECELFCEIDPNSHTGAAHAYSLRAASYGAKVHLCKNLDEAKSASEEKAKLDSDSLLVPLGFDCVEFNFHYRKALESEWLHVLSLVPNAKALWLPVGSGTLLRNFASVLSGTQTRIYGVNVHVLNCSDSRIADLSLLPRVKIFSSSLRFSETTSQELPFPSNAHYDAKVAAFISQYGDDHDVWWNVAQ